MIKDPEYLGVSEHYGQTALQSSLAEVQGVQIPAEEAH